MSGGKLLIFSAPSGSGKTTIVRRLLEENFHLEFSVSACSRPKRATEKDGVDYYFISAEEFKQKIKNEEFLEWQEVYKDHFYGTLKSEVDRIWVKNYNVIFDVDVLGGLNIKKSYPEKSLAVFVMPPSVAHLEERLKLRKTETKESIQNRLKKAAYEITFADKFDKIIVNDNLEVAIDEAKQLVRSFLNPEK
jgi:guanylate kinase